MTYLRCSALHLVVFCPHAHRPAHIYLCHPPPRRGKSKREITRCLKRYAPCDARRRWLARRRDEHATVGRTALDRLVRLGDLVEREGGGGGDVQRAGVGGRE
jgi:hypothetical protein